MTAGTLTGGGSVMARGGSASGHGPGGGGRVALVVTNAGADFAGFTGAVGAYGRNRSGAGTVYLETAAHEAGKGELIVDNAGLIGLTHDVFTDLNGLQPVVYEFSRVTITNAGLLAVGPDDILILSNAVVAGDAANANEGLTINGGTVVPAADFAFSNLFIRIAAAGSTFSPASSLTIGTNAEFRVDQPHVMTGNVLVASGGKLSHTANPSAQTESYKIDLTLDGSLIIEENGSVDVTGRGFPVNYGPGTPLVGNVGASHGGLGVGGLSCYGSLTDPINLGSGGRSVGAGGGAIRLAVSGTISNAGAIRANAAMVTQRTGAAGSISLTAGALAGTGPIEANSATNVTSDSPGGGGRVAVAVTNAGENVFAYAGAITAYGGRKPAATSGGAGTVYVRNPGQGIDEGTLIVDNDNLTGLGTEISSNVTDTTVANVLIQRKGYLMLATNQALTVGGVWSNGASFAGLTDSAVIFAGGAGSTSTIYGVTTFKGLTCVQPGKTLLFEAAATNAVAEYGRLLLRGDAASKLVLRSTVNGTAWHLTADALTEQDIEFVDVKDSDAGGGATVIAKNSAGEGQQNVNWTFMNVTPGETNTWTGNGNTLWGAVENWDLARAPVETDAIVIPGGRPNYPVFDASRTMNRLTIQSGGSVSLNGFDLTVTNAAVIAGTLIASGTESVTFQGDVDFTGGAITPAFSTIVLAGSAAQSINLGGLTFYKVRSDNSADILTFSSGFAAMELRCEAPTGTRRLRFAQHANVTLRDLVLRGASPAATNIRLRSTAPGQKWKLAVSGYRSVRGVDVQDSDASVGLAIPALDSADSDRNVNWTFDVAPAMWTPTSGNNFHTAANWTPAVVPDAGTRVLVESGAAMTMTGAVSVLDFTVGGGTGAVSVTVNGLLTVVENLIVLSNGTVAINQPCVVSGLYVQANGLLTHSGNSTTEANTLKLTVLGDAVVDGNGGIDVTAKGYGVKEGPGQPPNKSDGAGSYGGFGWGGGPCYGSTLAPTNIGSGGRDCKGGGAILMTVRGTIRNDGLIAADGMVAHYGGGSGGSIWLSSGALIGVGVIRADGGRAVDSHRSGGGGRISLAVTNAGADFSGFATNRITVFGGKQSIYGTDSGGSGTIYFQDASARPGRGLVRVANNNHTSVPYTDVPAFTNGVADEADRAVFRVMDGARLRLTTNFTVGNIWLDTANAVLDLGSYTLTVNAREHALTPGSVANYGAIIWKGLPPGALIIVK